MPRLALFALLAAGLAGAAADPPAPAARDAAAAKQALQKLGDFVGGWKGNGQAKEGGKETLWKETLTVGWKFKGTDSWLALDVADGKFVKSGVLRYDPAAKGYTLTLTDLVKSQTKYDGKLVKGNLVMTSKDAATGDVRRLTLYTLADGARLVFKAETQAKGKGLFSDRFQVAATKAGEAFAGGPKKPECVVTGGLGTVPVSYMGRTYYVCCSGCKDEFDTDPKKYAEAFDNKK